MTLTLTRLSPALGAVVEACNLAEPLSETEFAAIFQALLDH